MLRVFCLAGAATLSHAIPKADWADAAQATIEAGSGTLLGATAPAAA